LHMAQLMPLPLTVSCFSKIQIGFTFLVPAHPGSPGKGPLNACVCVCHSIPISTKIRLMKALVWPVATYGCESWTLGKNEETCLDASEMIGLRKILQVFVGSKENK